MELASQILAEKQQRKKSRFSSILSSLLGIHENVLPKFFWRLLLGCYIKLKMPIFPRSMENRGRSAIFKHANHNHNLAKQGKFGKVWQKPSNCMETMLTRQRQTSCLIFLALRKCFMVSHCKCDLNRVSTCFT